MKKILLVASLLTIAGCSPALTPEQVKVVNQACLDAGLVPRTEYGGLSSTDATAVICTAGARRTR